MEGSNRTVKIKKYILEAPEGGWGYLIAIAVVIIFFSIATITIVFGLLFNEFLQELQMNSTSVTLLTGVMAMCYAISGFLTGPMLNVMSKRKLALLAAIIFNIGIFGNIFTYSAPVFFICQGVMHGIGIGVLYNISCTMLNEYFVKKRLIVMSIVQTISAIKSIGAPIVIKWCLDEYGYRGTMLLLAGAMSNNLVAVALLQPVEWHMKKIEITNEEDGEAQLLLQNYNKHNNEGNETSVLKLDEEGLKKSLSTPSETKRSIAMMKVFNAFLDAKLLKEIILSFALLGSALSVFADGIFNLMLPQALYFEGWDKDYVAFALSLSAFGDLAGRIFLVGASKWISKLGSQETFIIVVTIGFCSRLGMLWSTLVTTKLVYIAIIGFTRCSVTTLMPVVVADTFSPEKFTSAMGFCMLLSGVLNLILGPAVGAVRDYTNSYDIAFYILTLIFGVVILFWSIEICCKRNTHKREVPKENLEKNKRQQNA